MFTAAIYAAPIVIVRGRFLFMMHMGFAGEDTAVLHSEQNQRFGRGFFWIAKSIPETVVASQLARAAGGGATFRGRQGAESKGSRTNVANHNRTGFQGGSSPEM